MLTPWGSSSSAVGFSGKGGYRTMQDINNKLAAIVDLLTKMLAAQGKTNELLYTIIDKLDVIHAAQKL